LFRLLAACTVYYTRIYIFFYVHNLCDLFFTSNRTTNWNKKWNSRWKCVRARRDSLPPANIKHNRCKPPRACWRLTKEWPLTLPNCTGRAENHHSEYWRITYYNTSTRLSFTTDWYTIFCIFFTIESDGTAAKLECRFRTYDSRWCGETRTISKIKAITGDLRCSVWQKSVHNYTIPASCSR